TVLLSIKPPDTQLIDPTFNAPADLNYTGVATILADQKIVAAYQSGSSESIVRLNSDGSEDPDFEPHLPDEHIYRFSINQLIEDREGGLLLLGILRELTGSPSDNRPHLVRLLPSGTLDTEFSPPIEVADIETDLFHHPELIANNAGVWLSDGRRLHRLMPHELAGQVAAPENPDYAILGMFVDQTDR